MFLKFHCFRTLSNAKENFVQKVFPIGYEIAEKNANTQTHTHTHTDRQTDIFVFILVEIYEFKLLSN